MYIHMYVHTHTRSDTHTHVSASLERSCWRPRTVVVDIQPLAVPAMPDTGLFRLCGARPALAIDILRQADVGNAGGIIANNMNMGVQDGGVDWLAVLG